MKTSKIVLILGGLIYLAFGLLFFVNPQVVTQMDGIILPSSSAANSIRAFFGGMEIGLGLLLFYFALNKERIIYGLIVFFMSIGVTSLARLYGILFAGASDKTNRISFASEFGFAVWALVCYIMENKRKVHN